MGFRVECPLVFLFVFRVALRVVFRAACRMVFPLERRMVLRSQVFDIYRMFTFWRMLS